MMYGQTEATARMAYLDWRDASKKIGSIGKSIPFTEMWLENKKGEKIKKSGEIGELIFKSNILIGDLESGKHKGTYMNIYTSESETIEIEN